MVRVMLQHDPETRLPLEGTLTRFDGTTLRLPDDLLGHVVVVHFWTIDCPPGAPWFQPLEERRDCSYALTEPAPEKNVMMVGVNLDDDRQAAHAYAEEHLPGWVHTYAGPNPEHPLVQRYAVQELPASWVLLTDGYTLNTEADRYLTYGKAPLEAASDAIRWVVRRERLHRPKYFADGVHRAVLSMRLVELQRATDVHIRKWDFNHETKRIIVSGEELFSSVPPLVGRASDELKQQFRKAYDGLKRDEDGHIRSGRKVRHARELVTAHRRLMQRAPELVQAAKDFERLFEVEVDEEAIQRAVSRLEPMQVPDDFPEDEPE
jgi:hypothetical protein